MNTTQTQPNPTSTIIMAMSKNSSCDLIVDFPQAQSPPTHQKKIKRSIPFSDVNKMAIGKNNISSEQKKTTTSASKKIRKVQSCLSMSEYANQHKHSNDNDTPQGMRRRVSFSDVSKLTFVKDLTPLKSDLWYTEQETMGFKYEAAYKIRKITSTMSMAEYAKLKSNDTSAFMGLEAHLFESPNVGYKRSTERKKAQRGAVLLEQFRQMKLGIEDPDALANVSEARSCVSRERAHIIGLLHIADES